MTRAPLLVALLAVPLLSAALPSGWPDPPAVAAEAFLLLDGRTGQTLAEHEADVPRPVASTVKVLTALTVVRRVDTSATVTVGQEVTGLEGASVGLRPGDTWSVTDLLEAVLVRSGNDAAMALAVHVGGTVEGFLELMREDARALGLDDFVLVSPSGLDDRNRLSARHLAVVTRAALEEPEIARLVAAAEVELPSERAAQTRNELLRTYPGATGVKTGYTAAAGWSVIASARRDGRTLIAVVLDSTGPDQRFTDAAALLDHGYEAFTPRTPERAFRIRVAGDAIEGRATGRALLVPVEEPELEVEVPVPVEAAELPSEVPVKWAGTTLDTAVIELDEAERGSASGGAALARYLVDRAYAAMRAANAAGTWNR